MAIDVTYTDNSGKEKTSFIETRDDTNLLLGMPKSPFTLLRSHFEDANGDTQYEFWLKCCKRYRRDYAYWGRVDDYPWYGLYSLDGVFYKGVNADSYPSRSEKRPRKVVLDSGRTIVHDNLTADKNLIDDNATNNCWTYAGSTLDGIFGGHADGNCKIYGYLVQKRIIESAYFSAYHHFMCAAYMHASDRLLTKEQIKKLITDQVGDSNYFENEPVGWDGQEVVKGDSFNLVFSGLIAEIRNWKITSNTPPTPNTYYVAVLTKKKHDLLDVKTTHDFGEKCGDVLGGDWADRLSEEQYNTRVVDDMVLMI